MLNKIWQQAWRGLWLRELGMQLDKPMHSKQGVFYLLIWILWVSIISLLLLSVLAEFLLTLYFWYQLQNDTLSEWLKRQSILKYTVGFQYWNTLLVFLSKIIFLFPDKTDYTMLFKNLQSILLIRLWYLTKRLYSGQQLCFS